MKRAFVGIAIVVALVLAIVIAAPFVIPVETYKGQITRRVESATGRELTIEGDIDLSILPRTQLTAAKVRFANAAWAKRDTMASLENLKVRVNPWALLSGELAVEAFILDRPEIHLAVNKQGKANWSFPAAKTAEKPGKDTAAGGDGGIGLADIHLEDVRLVDGTVTYTDMAADTTETFNKVNLNLALKSLDAPFSADGRLTWNKETLKLALTTGPPRKLMAGKPTNVEVKLDSDPIQLSYTGTLTNAEPRTLKGDVDLTIPSVKKLAAWAGNPLTARKNALERFHLAGSVSAKGPLYTFTADTLRLDDIKGSGSVGLDLGGAKPVLNGNLKLGVLDVTPYLPEPTQEGKTTDQADTGSVPPGWSTKPIDMSALGAANVDFDITAKALKARKIDIGQSALSVKLRDSRLTIELTEMQLYDGSGSGTIVVNARPKVPEIRESMTLKKVSAQPLLRDAAGFERLRGTGSLTFDVTAKGRSQKELIQNMNGTGAVDFKDGAIVGINLAQMVRNVKTAFTATEKTQETDFAELAGTFTITDGVLKNDDLLLLNPLLRVRGEGRSNLVERRVDYTITPKAVASTVGQGGNAGKSGIAVPVIITGPWHDLSYKPDLESMLKSAIKDPGKVKKQAEETLKKLRSGGSPGTVLEGLTGGGAKDGGDTGGSGSGSVEEKAKDKAKDAIDNLFGN